MKFQIARGAPARILAVTLALLLGVAGLVSPHAQADVSPTPTRTVTLTADRVVHTSSVAPDQNFADRRTPLASRSTYATFLGFPAVDLKPGEEVTGVSLDLFVAHINGTGQTEFAVTVTSSDWEPTAVTYLRQPAPLGGTVNTTTSGQVRSTASLQLDVPSVSDHVVQGSSFVVTNEPSNSAVSFHGSGSNEPRLVVTISAEASAAEEVVPTPQPESAGDGKLVFAHYFPPYPISLDNREPGVDYYSRHYLVPGGENGKFAEVGGLLRDRPVPRAPLGGDWRMEDLKTEVRQAMAGGIDGFAVDILGLQGDNWDRTVMLMQAAAEVSDSFKIMLQPDATASAGRASAAELAARLAELASYPSVYKLSDGRVVVSPFKTENKTPAQWAEVLEIMEREHGVATAFLPLFLDAGKMYDFDSMSIGFGNWGERDPGVVTNGTDHAARAHDLGKLWMQPVSIQDVRPNSGIFEEAGNTENLRATWDQAISQDADLVLLVTWNDYSEGTQFAPSRNHGYTYLDINRYFATKFKTGSYPAIENDVIHITHRVHRHDARPAHSEVMRQRTGGNRIEPRDTVEVMTVLTAPATVTVTVGNVQHSYSAPAGVATELFGLQDGYTTATAVRSGETVATVRTKDPVTATVTQQDMTYHAVSSGR